MENRQGPRKPRFRPGSFVRVHSKERITELLDAIPRLDGCLFMDQMWEYCGRELRIEKVVTNLFDERRCRMYKARVPLYILEGSICRGEAEGFERRCDHSCYFFWHEDWIGDV